MKSSTKNKHKVDDVSRETQRLVMSSSVHLPYHIPKQKSLKDFLNRQKIPTENQVSLTGPKKLLQKAWEFIETKEQTVEKFYNEISIQDEDNEKAKSSSNDDIQTFQTEKNISFVDLDDINYNKEKLVVEFDDEENCENSSINSESSDCDEVSSVNDDENSNEATSLCSEEFPIQPVEHQDNEKLKHHFKSNKFDDMAKQFIDNEAELSELDNSSDDEDSFINSSENEEIEISKKKKRPLILLSDSSDDEHISDTEIEMTSNDIIPLYNELEKNTPTPLIDNGHNSDTEMKIESNDLIPLFNESEKNISTQQLMELCSGQFQTQPESQENELEDNFDSSVPLDNADEYSENDQSDEDKMPKLTSVNDFFDDEAELSESDWSSDDENQDAEKLDKLDEEDGDKDELDENLIKDGLDKIYMRQLLDDDIKQVTELKERLLEDGELYSDTGRKRKFQWGDNDQDDDSFKKPLFSDSEDENEVLNGDDGDDLSGLWRKERYKRESYLSQTNDSGDEILPDDCEESGDNSQTSMILAVKKPHVIKLKNEGIFQSKDKSIVVNVNHSTVFDSPNKNKKTENGLILPCVAKVTKAICINSQSNKLLKGSFMKRRNVNKIVTLLNMNKNNDQVDSGNYITNKDIRPLTTITAKACNNPFAYMLLDGKKTDNENVISKEINTEKNDNGFYSQPATSVQLTEETKKKKNTNSILMHLE